MDGIKVLNIADKSRASTTLGVGQIGLIPSGDYSRSSLTNWQTHLRGRVWSNTQGQALSFGATNSTSITLRGCPRESGKHYPNEHVFLEGSLLVSPLKMGCRFRPLAVSYQRVDLAHVSEL